MKSSQTDVRGLKLSIYSETVIIPTLLREQSSYFFIAILYMSYFSKNDDFINASYVIGGPLLNNFILTQAPLTSTINDFWRMVWQEKNEYIFMLCEAVDPESVALFNSSAQNHCPYYWPRFFKNKFHQIYPTSLQI